jgi:RNase P subunit RPR2
MMPCKFCGSFTKDGKLRPGIKQVGRTKRAGSEFVRVYRCQECGATMRMAGDVRSKIFVEEWKPIEEHERTLKN